MDNAEQQPAETAHAKPRTKSHQAIMLGILAVAAFPLLYLGVHRSHTAQAAARIENMPQQAPDVGALEAAVRTNPSATNRLNLSEAYINTGRPSQAENLLHALLSADPGNSAAWNNLCVAQVQLLELKDAPESCQHAIALKPDFQLAKNNLSWANTETKTEQDALKKMETTAPPARDRAFYLAEGLHEMHLGSYDAAIQSWQKMLVLNSQDATAANNIGTALMMSHRPKIAEGWFEKAVAWDPAMQIAKNNLLWAQGELQTKTQP